MSLCNYRVLIVASHPVQYAVPTFRLMAQHPQLDILVAYCSLQGAEPGLDPGFGVEVTWDIPLLDGYQWMDIPNLSPKPGLGHFFGLSNLQLWNLVRRGKFDAVVVYTGYVYASFWIVAAATKSCRTALLFTTDAHTLTPRNRQSWKVPLKKWLLPYIYNLADIVLVHSSGGVKLMSSLGISEQFVQVLPYVVNNDWWINQAKQVNRAKVREQWNIPETSPVVLFCAKLQSWKRPQDVLRAYARVNVSGTYLVLAGEGPLRAELEAEAEALQVSDRVRFIGFINQSQLPSVYRAADLFVLPSEYEPFGVVVNEAMLCGCPVVISDRVGACYDLIRNGETGLVYPCGDTDALATILQEVLPDSERLNNLRQAAYKRMETWSPRDNVEALVQAVGNASRKSKLKNN